MTILQISAKNKQNYKYPKLPILSLFYNQLEKILSKAKLSLSTNYVKKNSS